VKKTGEPEYWTILFSKWSLKLPFQWVVGCSIEVEILWQSSIQHDGDEGKFPFRPDIPIQQI
jgi:hypothetical protein